MKKVCIGLIIGLTTSFLLSMTTIQETKKSHAEVDQYQGIYVFTDSKPLKEYEYLGTVKLTLGLGSGQYQNVRNVLIKRAKKDYPQADGLIMNFKDGGTDRADAIKFKD
ncbi:MAG: hypothetical protein ACK514_10920 [Bacteroidota bacterium]|jgi:hypothetical protein|nr:hypothetical protein [Cytophagales bacterium]MCE2958935.1 hypothetical protein [Flammeovirgaceae bacterium]MCZ8070190.1 hypothetical protein [Cytophagales bacterium]